MWVGRAGWPGGREHGRHSAERKGKQDVAARVMRCPFTFNLPLQAGWLTRTAGNVQGAEWEQKTVLTPVSALPSLCLSIEFDHRWRYRCPSLLSSASSLVRLHHIGVALILNTRSQDALDTTAERTGQAEELGDV